GALRRLRPLSTAVARDDAAALVRPGADARRRRRRPDRRPAPTQPHGRRRVRRRRRARRRGRRRRRRPRRDERRHVRSRLIMAAVDRLAAARARLRQLKAEHEAGKLDDRRYDEARRAVEREIGEGLLAEPPAASPRPSRSLVALLSVFVVALAGVGYWQTGSPSLMREAAPVAG